MKSFEELNCWKRTNALRQSLSELIKAFPAEEKYRLIDQIKRAARSAPANIAEGYGTYHYQENVQHCRRARGSLYEIIAHLIVAEDEGYISDQQLVNLKNDCRIPGPFEWIH